jgi:hypothetical protein
MQLRMWALRTLWIKSVYVEHVREGNGDVLTGSYSSYMTLKSGMALLSTV